MRQCASLFASIVVICLRCSYLTTQKNVEAVRIFKKNYEIFINIHTAMPKIEVLKKLQFNTSPLFAMFSFSDASEKNVGTVGQWDTGDSGTALL